ncbi:MAG: hypothetical protein M3Z21_14120 [Pseudomonadota bacterium]|nr:hypothetical protein [Pseudomonadota bacterium]
MGSAVGGLVKTYETLAKDSSNEALETLADQIEELVAATAALPASGLEGVLCLTVMLGNYLSDLLTYEGRELEEVRAREKLIRQLLDNIVTALERATGIDAERFGGSYFILRHAAGNTHPDPKDSGPTH